MISAYHPLAQLEWTSAWDRPPNFQQRISGPPHTGPGPGRPRPADTTPATETGNTAITLTVNRELQEPMHAANAEPKKLLNVHVMQLYVYMYLNVKT